MALVDIDQGGAPPLDFLECPRPVQGYSPAFGVELGLLAVLHCPGKRVEVGELLTEPIFGDPHKPGTNRYDESLEHWNQPLRSRLSKSVKNQLPWPGESLTAGVEGHVLSSLVPLVAGGD